MNHESTKFSNTPTLLAPQSRNEKRSPSSVSLNHLEIEKKAISDFCVVTNNQATNYCMQKIMSNGHSDVDVSISHLTSRLDNYMKKVVVHNTEQARGHIKSILQQAKSELDANCNIYDSVYKEIKKRHNNDVRYYSPSKGGCGLAFECREEIFTKLGGAKGEKVRTDQMTSREVNGDGNGTKHPEKMRCIIKGENKSKTIKGASNDSIQPFATDFSGKLIPEHTRSDRFLVPIDVEPTHSEVIVGQTSDLAKSTEASKKLRGKERGFQATHAGQVVIDVRKVFSESDTILNRCPKEEMYQVVPHLRSAQQPGDEGNCDVSDKMYGQVSCGEKSRERCASQTKKQFRKQRPCKNTMRKNKIDKAIFYNHGSVIDPVKDNSLSLKSQKLSRIAKEILHEVATDKERKKIAGKSTFRKCSAGGLEGLQVYVQHNISSNLHDKKCGKGLKRLVFEKWKHSVAKQMSVRLILFERMQEAITWAGRNGHGTKWHVSFMRNFNADEIKKRGGIGVVATSYLMYRRKAIAFAKLLLNFTLSMSLVSHRS